MKFKENIKKIYSHIANDYSKEMFINRLMYSLTSDNQYILNVIKMTPEGRVFISKLQNKKKNLIFGAGAWGKEILNTFSNVKFECFVDSKTKKSNYAGLQVISFDEYLSRFSEETIIIATRLYHQEIYEQLKKSGISDANIINAGKMIDEMSHRQYFDLPELKTRKENLEIFVDAGSFDGATSLAFLDWCGESIGKIWAFEPEKKNAQICEANMKKAQGGGYNIIPFGLWNKKETLHFQSGASGASRIIEDGDSSIEVNCLDAMLNKEPITFIKMDLEGAEYNALLGAEKTIKEYKPKLAISIYHKPEDIWELPQLILKMNPDYHFYFGHYSIAAAETVLYTL